MNIFEAARRPHRIAYRCSEIRLVQCFFVFEGISQVLGLTLRKLGVIHCLRVALIWTVYMIYATMMSSWLMRTLSDVRGLVFWGGLRSMSPSYCVDS